MSYFPHACITDSCIMERPFKISGGNRIFTKSVAKFQRKNILNWKDAKINNVTSRFVTRHFGVILREFWMKKKSEGKGEGGIEHKKKT